MARRIAVMFPGQASQQVGMGRLAYARFAAARDVFDRIDAALNLPIRAACFEGPAERLLETRWQQPAVFACSLALFSAWRVALAEGDEIAGAAGHSLGEYGALVTAGAISLEDAARLVALRGRLMQEAAERSPGGMCAVIGLDHATVQALCAEASQPEGGMTETVVLANDNGPDQQIISGSLSALARASQAAKAQGARRVLPLKVAGAFHSPLMQPAVAALAEAIEQMNVEPCAFPVIGNCGAGPLVTTADVRQELIRQVTSPVRWHESVLALNALAPDLWVDTGPGAVVAGMAARILPGIDIVRAAALVDVEAPA